MTQISASHKISISEMRGLKNDILKTKRAASTKDRYNQIKKMLLAFLQQKQEVDIKYYFDFLDFLDTHNMLRNESGKNPLCSNTVYTYKAAYQYHLAKELETALKHYNKFDLEKNRKLREQHRRIARRCYTDLQRLETDYNQAQLQLQNTKFHEAKQSRPMTQDNKGLIYKEHSLKQSRFKNYPGYRKNSKRNSLKGLPVNWQWQFINQINPEYKLQTLIMTLTGCRPVEFTKKLRSQDSPGVQIGARIAKNGKTFLAVIVCGGKHDGDKKGHEYRSFLFDPDGNPFAKTLVRELPSQETVIVGLPTETTVKQFCDHGRYVGRKIFPGKGVTLYSLRHAFASNLKAEVTGGGVGQKIKIAKAMGQISTRTQQHYGTVAQGKGGTGLLGVEASGKVRVAHTNHHNIAPTPILPEDESTSMGM